MLRSRFINIKSRRELILYVYVSISSSTALKGHILESRFIRHHLDWWYSSVVDAVCPMWEALIMSGAILTIILCILQSKHSKNGHSLYFSLQTDIGCRAMVALFTFPNDTNKANYFSLSHRLSLLGEGSRKLKSIYTDLNKYLRYFQLNRSF